MAEDRIAVRERRKRMVQRRRAALMLRLGNVCALAVAWEDCSPDLQFDHINGRTYRLRDLSQHQRLLRYEREAERGEIQLLCSYHNQVKSGRNRRRKDFV